MTETAASNTITKLIVPEYERLDFFPWMFTPRHLFRGENRLYDIMSRLSPDYNGGYWTFVKTANGAGYAYPELKQDLIRLQWANNGFDGEASPEIAGLIATCIAIGSFWGAGSDEHFAERFHALDDYIYSLPSETFTLVKRCLD